MKDLGKTIAKYRKEHKKNQSDIAKMLENYDIYVKQNTISAWESGTSQPSARQLLALCEILEIYDVYTDFIGKNPLNPLRNLNEEGINKVMDYIQILERTGLLTSFRSMCSENARFSIRQFQPEPVLFWMEKIIKWSPLLIFQRKLPLEYISVVTVWSLVTMTQSLSGLNRRNNSVMAKSASFIWMEMLILRNFRITEKEPTLFLLTRNTNRFLLQRTALSRFLGECCHSPFYRTSYMIALLQ